MPFVATQMDLEIIIPSEVRQISQKSLILESNKNDTKELIHKTETDLKISKPNLSKRKHWGGIKWKAGIDIYTLLYME